MADNASTLAGEQDNLGAAAVEPVEWVRGGKKKVLDAYLKLHERILGMHWIWCAIMRMNAGESEQSVMEDFGYTLSDDHQVVPQAARDVLFDVAMKTLRQIATTPRNRKARVNANAAVHFIETQMEAATTATPAKVVPPPARGDE